MATTKGRQRVFHRTVKFERWVKDGNKQVIPKLTIPPTLLHAIGVRYGKGDMLLIHDEDSKTITVMLDPSGKEN